MHTSQGYYRKGQALEGLLNFSEASESYVAGLNIEPENVDLKKARNKLVSLISEVKTNEEKAAPPNPDSDRCVRV